MPVDKNQELKQLFQQTLDFVEENKGGNYPYQNYLLLNFLTALHKPNRILEAGTALGLTAISMALGWDNSIVDTIDKDERIFKLAKDNFIKFGLEERINLLEGSFLDIIPSLPNNYEMIFFDGFAPGLTVFLALEEKLDSGGLLVYANLGLGGDRKKILERTHDIQIYTNPVQIEDTILAIKQ